MGQEYPAEQFINPSDEYTPIPFWFWNDRLDKNEILRQIHDFRDKGVMGFVIHPRIGIPKETEYLSDEYMSFVKCAVTEASRLKMKVILYDEGMYPSGSAHGLVVKGNPDFASKGLKVLEYPCSADTTSVEPHLEQGEQYISAQAVKVQDGVIAQASSLVLFMHNGKISFHKPDHGFWKVLVFIKTYTRGTIRGIHQGEDDREPEVKPSADILNPQAVKSFIHLTHERYYECLEEYFGNTITAMFTDEPNIVGRCANAGILPWTEGFMDFYLEMGNLETDLPALFFQTDGNVGAIRRKYRQAVNRKLEASYYIPLSQWCETHGIALTGHPEKSDEIGFLKHFQIPGQDLVWRWVAPEDGKALAGEHSTLAKCSSDAARHYKKRRNANECFGCCGPKGIHWAFSADDMKWYLDWLFVRGVNLVYPHAFYYSVRGKERYGERPPDAGPNNIWWKYYKSLSNYIKRLCWLMTDSVNQAQVAVLCEEDRLPWKIVKPLYQSQIEFNYLEDKTLCLKGKIADGFLTVEEQKYRLLLIEDKELITGPVLEKVKLFQAAGGKVIVYDALSGYSMDGIATVPSFEDVTALVKGSIENELFCHPHNRDLRVSHVIKEGLHFYLLVNEGEKEISTEIHLASSGAIEKWDAWKGTVEEMPVTITRDHTVTVELTLNRRESIILCSHPDKNPSVRCETTQRCNLAQQCEPAQPSVSIPPGLSMQPGLPVQPDLIIQGSKPVQPAQFQSDEYALRLELDQDWSVIMPDRQIIAIDSLHSQKHHQLFTGICGVFTYIRKFNVQKAASTGKVFLDLGKVYEIAHVTVNGKEIGFQLWSPFVFDLSAALLEGENELRVEVSNSMANLYEEGSFPSGLHGPVKILFLNG